MARKPEYFDDLAKERGWLEKKVVSVQALAIEDYVKTLRMLSEASWAMLENAIEVAVNVDINQDFVDRIGQAKQKREREEIGALSIQFGVKRAKFSSPFVTDKMKNMNIGADGSASVDAVDTGNNPLFGSTGLNMGEDG